MRQTFVVVAEAIAIGYMSYARNPVHDGDTAEPAAS